MRNLTSAEFESIQRWLLRNARPLDQARWAYAFAGGSRTAVLDALAAYQNPDGGFGHALEADSWDPYSSPLQTWTACTILVEIDADPEEPIVQNLLRYLHKTPDFTGNLWRSTVPTTNAHPRASWWSWESDAVSVAEWGYNPSAALAGYVLRWEPEGTPLYRRALQVAAGAMDDALSRGVDGNRHLTVCHRTLVDAVRRFVPEAVQRKSLPRFDSFADRVDANAAAAIGRDPSQWFVTYATLPTDLIQSPLDPGYEADKDLVDAALDALINARDDEGVWDISWTWDDFPEAFAVSRVWWRGTLAVERVRLLDAYGRISGREPNP